MSVELTTLVKSPYGTAAEWTAANPILPVGVMGIESDTGQVKFGDGVTAWNSKTYLHVAAAGEIASLDNLPDGVNYKRIAAAAATALNASTIVAGTQWGSGNDGNGGQPPAPKPTEGTPVGGADGVGKLYAVSKESAAFTIPGSGSTYWMVMAICSVTSTGAVVAAYTGSGTFAGGTILSCDSGQTLKGFVWRIV